MNYNYNQNLRHFRLSAHLTQEQISRKLNISRSCYCQYELGKRCPNLEILKTLSGIYHVPVDWLVCPLGTSSKDSLDGPILSLEDMIEKYLALPQEKRQLVNFMIQFLNCE